MAKKATKTKEVLKKIERFRDAESGRYTTKKYADKHPKTTVKETDKIKVKKPNKSS